MRTGSLALAVMLLSASAAFAAECYSSTFFNGKSLVASTTSGTQFKMIFTPDGRMTRQPSGKAGKKSSGTWKLDTSGFCTSWKGAETNCYTVVPSGNDKWPIQQCGLNSLKSSLISPPLRPIDFPSLLRREAAPRLAPEAKRELSPQQRGKCPWSQKANSPFRSIDTPTVCNLIEIVAPERRGIGYTASHLHCPFPDLPPMVGFAKTATIRARDHVSELSYMQKRMDYLDYVAAAPRPSVVV